MFIVMHELPSGKQPTSIGKLSAWVSIAQDCSNYTEGKDLTLRERPVTSKH